MSSRRSRYDDDYNYDYERGGGGGGGERWDRQRFQRERARSRGPAAQDIVRVEEYDRGPDRRDIRIEVDERRRAPRPSRYREPDDQDDPEYTSPRARRRPQVFEEEERIQISGREVAPYRPREREREREREYDAPPARKPARPMYGRRQSSLDTYDRRPPPRYTDDERDINVKINVVPPPVPAPKSQYPREREYWYKDPYEGRREEIGEVKREVVRRREVEEESSSSEEMVEERPKRGKTRMPKRLVHKAALIQLGYAFEEEEYFYVVRQALQKEQIDIVIKISESYFNDNKIAYRFQEDTALIEAPMPPPAPIPFDDPPPPEIIETVTTRIIQNPTDEEIEAIERRSRGARSSRAGSTASSGSSSSTATVTERNVPEGLKRTVVAELRADPGHPIVIPEHGSKRRSRAKSVAESSESADSVRESARELAVVPARRKSVREERRDIKAEIRALEAEERRLSRNEKREKKREEKREGSGESEGEKEKEKEGGRSATIVRVEKDKRGRLSLVRPAK